MAARVALVTGANRGIGFEVCRQLAKSGYTVILTSSDLEAAVKAVGNLGKHGLTLTCHQLDVTDSESINATFNWVEKKYGKLDVLVNNAGVALDTVPIDWDDREKASFFNTSAETVRKTFDTNACGAIRMVQKFAPLMKKQRYGRIVNVSSELGQLSSMRGGWLAYRTSKAALNAFTKIAADELQDFNVLVNSAAPGWVKTDLGGPNAELTVEEGADTIVWLATLPDGGASGGFFQQRKSIPW